MTRPLLHAGLHQPNMAVHLPRAMISLNWLLGRQSDFPANGWILDPGAFSRITGGWGRIPVAEYAREVRRWSGCGNLQAAAQDMMCEPFVLQITGLSVERHQEIRSRNYLELREALGGNVPVMPVLQGFEPEEYARHKEYLSRGEAAAGGTKPALRGWVQPEAGFHLGRTT